MNDCSTNETNTHCTLNTIYSNIEIHINFKSVHLKRGLNGICNFAFVFKSGDTVLCAFVFKSNVFAFGSNSFDSYKCIFEMRTLLRGFVMQ